MNVDDDDTRFPLERLLNTTPLENQLIETVVDGGWILPQITRLCQLNRTFRDQICRNVALWRALLLRDFDMSSNRFEMRYRTPAGADMIAKSMRRHLQRYRTDEDGGNRRIDLEATTVRYTYFYRALYEFTKRGVPLTMAQNAMQRREIRQLSEDQVIDAEGLRLLRTFSGGSLQTRAEMLTEFTYKAGNIFMSFGMLINDPNQIVGPQVGLFTNAVEYVMNDNLFSQAARDGRVLFPSLLSTEVAFNDTFYVNADGPLNTSLMIYEAKTPPSFVITFPGPTDELIDYTGFPPATNAASPAAVPTLANPPHYVVFRNQNVLFLANTQNEGFYVLRSAPDQQTAYPKYKVVVLNDRYAAIAPINAIGQISRVWVQDFRADKRFKNLEFGMQIVEGMAFMQPPQLEREKKLLLILNLKNVAQSDEESYSGILSAYTISMENPEEDSTLHAYSYTFREQDVQMNLYVDDNRTVIGTRQSERSIMHPFLEGQNTPKLSRRTFDRAAMKFFTYKFYT